MSHPSLSLRNQISFPGCLSQGVGTLGSRAWLYPILIGLGLGCSAGYAEQDRGSEAYAAQVSAKPGGQTPSEGTSSKPADPTVRIDSPPQAPAAQPIDRQPYRIELHLVADPSTRIDAAQRAWLIKEWQALVHRFVGAPWTITVASRPSPLAGGRLERLEADAFAGFDAAFDKTWLVRIDREESAPGLWFTGREYDTATRRLGPIQKLRSLVLAEAPRTLLQFARDLFSPVAEISRQEGGRALLIVRAASITPASPQGSVVGKGTVFLPLRLVSQKDGSVRVLRIPFTYLSVESVEGSTAQCAIVSALRDPFTQRLSRSSSLAAIGIRTGDSPLRYRFVNRPDKAPAAGYVLTARRVPEGLPHELGITDREGRIVLKPGFDDGLVILRLIAGTAEPVVEFPVMPGESSEERVIDVDPRYQAVGYQVRLDALRDEVVDLVALRARLESRMKARLEGEDYDGLEQALKEYSQLPPREPYAEQLTRLKAEATKQQVETKAAILTKNTLALFDELQALIDRYLDAEALTSYTEALARKRIELAEKSKPKPQGRGPSRAVEAPPPIPPTPSVAGNPRTAAPIPPPKPKPLPAAGGSTVPF